MALRRPLVVNAGEIQQLQGTDYSVPYDHFIRVDKSGDDTNYAVSSWDKPKLTLSSAITLITILGGDWTIYMGRGTFVENGGIVLPNGGANGIHLLGAGRGQTIIQSSLELSGLGGTNASIVRPGNKSVIQDLSIVGTAAAGLFQTPIGDGDSGTFTGVTLRNLTLIAASDAIRIRGASDFVAHDVICQTEYDCCVLNGSGASAVLWNCDFTTTGVGNFGTGHNQNAVLAAAGTTITIYGGSFVATGLSTDGSHRALAVNSGTAKAYGACLLASVGTFFDCFQSGGTLQISGCYRSDGASLVTSGSALEIEQDLLGEDWNPDANRVVEGDHSLVIASKLLIPNGVSMTVKNGGVLMVI